MILQLAHNYILTKRVLISGILLFALIFTTGCQEEQIILDIDSYIEFLNISESQIEEVRPIFDEISDIVNSYNLSIENDSQVKKGKQERRDFRLNLKIELLRQLNPVLSSLYEKLDVIQRNSLERSELYYNYLTTKRYVVNNIRPVSEVTYERFVTPKIELATDHIYTGEDYYKNWTIQFGLPMNSVSGRSIQKSINAGGRRSFPTSIQATLMDKTLLEREPAGSNGYPAGFDSQSYLEIRVIMSSRLHENFVDIEKWIPFLELSNGVISEPVKAIKRDIEWFEDRSVKLVTSNMPAFIFSNEELEEQFEKRPTPRRSIRLESHVAYYQLFFPAEINNAPILSDDISNMRLVFLQEIGSNNRAEGIWHLIW